MNVVDTSGWLEFFAGGPNANAFEEPIRAVNELLVPAISVYEAFKHLNRHKSLDVALEHVESMHFGRVIVLDSNLAMHASLVSIKHQLAMADAIVYAVAEEFDATLWTQDVDFSGLPNVKFFPKPNPAM